MVVIHIRSQKKYGDDVCRIILVYSKLIVDLAVICVEINTGDFTNKKDAGE